MTDIMRSSLVLPPLVTSPQNGPHSGQQLLDSFHNFHKQGIGAEQHRADATRSHAPPAGAIAGSPSSSLGHSPASFAGSNPAAMPSPLLTPVGPSRVCGKSPDRRAEENRKVEMKVEQGGAGGDDIITLFPRRKAGQTRPGGGRGPVVLNLELLEKFYGMPLHVAANRLVSYFYDPSHCITSSATSALCSDVETFLVQSTNGVGSVIF